MRHEAIYNLYKNVASILGDFDAFDANGIKVTIDEAAVTAEIARLQAEYDAKQYQRDRAAEYPSYADQFDLLYHGGFDAWKASIDAIKTKYPKP